MAGAPAFEEAVEVSPGEGVEGTPFGDDFLGSKLGVLAGEGGFEGAEVVSKDGGFFFSAVVFVKAAADEVGDVFHSAAAADVLEVESGELGVVLGEAKVREFGIAVNDGLEAGLVELCGDFRSGFTERSII